MTEIALRVCAVVAKYCEVEAAGVAETDHLFIDLHGDSLDRVEIVMELEVEFGIEIRDEDGEAMQTIGDAVRIVTAALAAGSSGPRP